MAREQKEVFRRYGTQGLLGIEFSFSLINKVYLYLLRSVQRVIMPRGVWNKPRPVSKKTIRKQTKRSITHRALWNAKTAEQKEEILQRLAQCRQKMKESRERKRKEGDVEVIDLTADV